MYYYVARGHNGVGIYLDYNKMNVDRQQLVQYRYSGTSNWQEAITFVTECVEGYAHFVHPLLPSQVIPKLTIDSIVFFEGCLLTAQENNSVHYIQVLQYV